MKPREFWNKVAMKLYISLQKEKKPLNFQEVSALQTIVAQGAPGFPVLLRL